MSVLAAIAVLAVLIIVHELGHFAAARAQGIHVNRFSIGFGPALWKYQGERTEYAVRVFPLGGFVGFPDDDPDSPIPPDDPNLLQNRPIVDRAIVISAGVIANFLFAYVLLTAQVGIFGVPNLYPGVAVPQLAEVADSPARAAGLEPGDVILAVGAEPLAEGEAAVETLQQAIQRSPNLPLELTVLRDGERLNPVVTPRADEEGNGRIGVFLSVRGESVDGELAFRRPNGIGEIIAAGAAEYQRIFQLTFEGFGRLIGNFSESADQIAGPVAIVAVGANIASNDAGGLFRFAALISINLGIINILPLPVLDGGQLVFLGIEALRGKPLPSKIREGIMQTGVVMLLGLAIFLVIRDTANLGAVQEMFNN
ncbi:RIP metalloprotease RseP [Rubidibacter lacunae KORDI 51-2]|uniref:Zinc metalloprotease n=1 Tax=Rubidibacter lacunae KORDI 51-2 TaxID=582515 RepID=U5DKQ8_9CHRO|nr:RIP metalloprotease RseP [Rubidibacter lacunae]ERN41139.1 RIP metalloprotease RseP [Rubidibacter lacunae KORDI 51-2]